LSYVCPFRFTYFLIRVSLLFLGQCGP
jgi:hypothetical protein